MNARRARRRSLEIAGTSAGGMPTRVKCLHVLVAHALAAGPGVNPLGDEALDQLPDWWRRRPVHQRGPASRRREAGRRDRLRHQLDPAAGRRRRRRRRGRSSTSTGGCRSSGSARASTAPGGWHPRRCERTFAACGEYAAVIRRARRRRDPVRRHVGLARRRATATSSSPACWPCSASSPRSSPATRRRALSFTGATRELVGAATRAAVPRRRHRRRLDRVRPRHDERSEARPASVDIGCVRMTERHLRTATRRPPREIARRRDRRHRRGAASRAARSSRSRARADPGRPGRLGDHRRRDRAGPARVRPGADPPLARSRRGGVRAVSDRLLRADARPSARRSP